MRPEHSKQHFDQYKDSYEEVHNRSLPPGVESEQFLLQKRDRVLGWLKEYFLGQEVDLLDFGCGTGRLSDLLLKTGRVRRYVGVDESQESILKARESCAYHQEDFEFHTRLEDVSGEVDVILAFNVFHHVEPSQRKDVVERLIALLRPGGKIIVWEHNPFNPVTRTLIRLCPFDEDAKLLFRRQTRRLFQALKLVDTSYVNLTPPNWHRLRLLSAFEDLAARVPIGTQYWMIFAKE